MVHELLTHCSKVCRVIYLSSFPSIKTSGRKVKLFSSALDKWNGKSIQGNGQRREHLDTRESRTLSIINSLYLYKPRQQKQSKVSSQYYLFSQEKWARRLFTESDELLTQQSKRFQQLFLFTTSFTRRVCVFANLLYMMTSWRPSAHTVHLYPHVKHV